MKTNSRSIREIIEAAGGAIAVAKQVSTSHPELTLSADAVYKWPHNGIPDRYWSIVIPMADSSADEIFAANEIARAEKVG